MDAVKSLFRDYVGSLGFDLGFQDIDAEMADFPGKYAPPGGALLLARIDGATAGAVALRDLDDGICEMKRLYVRPEARGHGLGRRLIERLIVEAGARGYRAMRLDTVPRHHDEAIALYRGFGFREIAPYCHNPLPGALFMELTLGGTVVSGA
tara:strand:+ start:230 stop:685 length:456 start_codon:yes stop_codon:yes gene_type:complete